MSNDAVCQDCQQKAWQVGLLTGLGRVYLCAACGADAIRNREAKGGPPARAWGFLMERLFGGGRN